MRINIFLIILFVGLNSWSAEYYRDNPPPFRFLGSNQGSVGSCQSEADVAALESVFWEMGHNVRLSAFYRHAFNWKNATQEELDDPDANLALTYSAADHDLLNKMGGVVPDFMMPDSTYGFEIPDYPVKRIPVSQVLVGDPSYKPFNVEVDYYTFQPGKSYSRTIEDLKKLVETNQAISLGIKSTILQGFRFNHASGLLRSTFEINDEVLGDSTHAVSVVGYDDSLYSDYAFSRPGALIVKNSWNSSWDIKSILGGDSYASEEDLAKLRYKISPGKNLPGYYAIPYALIDRLVANGNKVRFRHYKMDFHGFAAQYDQLQKNYEVVIAPYQCGRNTPKAEKATKKSRRMIQELGETLKHAAYKQTIGEDYSQENDKIFDAIDCQVVYASDECNEKYEFKRAFFSRNLTTGVDRATDFYNGKFNDFYCFHGIKDFNTPDYIYPNINHYQDRKILQTINEVTADDRSIMGWWSFMQSLYNWEVSNYVEANPKS